MFGMTDDNIKEPFNVFANFGYALQIQGIAYSLGVLFLVLILELFHNYILNQKYQTTTPADLFFKPYIRVFIQQFTVIIAMFFVMLFQASIFVALLLIIFRLIVDLAGIYISSNDKNLESVALFLSKKDKKQRSDIEIKKELEKFLK
jgi:hypothetical protein